MTDSQVAVAALDRMREIVQRSMALITTEGEAMTPATRRLCLDLLRLEKSAIVLCERWCETQPIANDHSHGRPSSEMRV